MSEQTFAQKIDKLLSAKAAEEIEEIDFHGCKGDKIEGLTEKFTHLRSIHAAGCGLKSLDGLPALKNLTELDVPDNAIADLAALANNTALVLVNLANNNIKELDLLSPLFNLPKLTTLYLDGNEVVDTPDNISVLFDSCPALQSVDEVNRDSLNGHDDDESDVEDDTESGGDDSGNLAVLEQSGELEEDEEDYVPGENDDDDEEDDFEEEDEEGDSEEDGSATEDVSPSMKAKKRAADGVDDVSAPKKATNGDA